MDDLYASCKEGAQAEADLLAGASPALVFRIMVRASRRPSHLRTRNLETHSRIDRIHRCCIVPSILCVQMFF
jgi:hypothetical protein